MPNTQHQGLIITIRALEHLVVCIRWDLGAKRTGLVAGVFRELIALCPKGRSRHFVDQIHAGARKQIATVHSLLCNECAANY